MPCAEELVVGYCFRLEVLELLKIDLLLHLSYWSWAGVKMSFSPATASEWNDRANISQALGERISGRTARPQIDLDLILT